MKSHPEELSHRIMAYIWIDRLRILPFKRYLSIPNKDGDRYKTMLPKQAYDMEKLN